MSYRALNYFFKMQNFNPCTKNEINMNNISNSAKNKKEYKQYLL